MNGLRAALTFLTILPAGAGGTRPLAAAPAWFPAVGLLLGAMIAALHLLLAAAGLRPPPCCWRGPVCGPPPLRAIRRAPPDARCFRCWPPRC